MNWHPYNEVPLEVFVKAKSCRERPLVVVASTCGVRGNNACRLFSAERCWRSSVVAVGCVTQFPILWNGRSPQGSRCKASNPLMPSQPGSDILPNHTGGLLLCCSEIGSSVQVNRRYTVITLFHKQASSIGGIMTNQKSRSYLRPRITKNRCHHSSHFRNGTTQVPDLQFTCAGASAGDCFAYLHLPNHFN